MGSRHCGCQGSSPRRACQSWECHVPRAGSEASRTTQAVNARAQPACGRLTHAGSNSHLACIGRRILGGSDHLGRKRAGRQGSRTELGIPRAWARGARTPQARILSDGGHSGNVRLRTFHRRH